MYRRLATAVAILLLVAALPAMTGAHGLSLLAAVSLDGNELTVRPVDFYRAPVEGGEVTAATGLPGARPVRPSRLPEVSPGLYRGAVAVPAAERFEIHVELVVMGELYQVAVLAQAGRNLGEEFYPLIPIEESRFPWGWVLYGLVLALLLAATGVAVRRLRHQGADEEG